MRFSFRLLAVPLLVPIIQGKALKSVSGAVREIATTDSTSEPVITTISVTDRDLAKRTSQRNSSVTVVKVADGRWRASYQLSAPVTTLRFERPAAFFRERIWNIVTPGYHIAREGELQIVVLDSGKAAQRELVFEFPEFSDNLPKEYEFFQPFTGGAVAIYTGHFNASFESAPGKVEQLRTVNIVPPANAHAIVRGRVSKARVTFTDSVGDGTYVYIGNSTPIETPDVVAVVDPGMPKWIADQFAREVPRLFAEYRKRFGNALPWKPVVLYSFHDTASSGLSSGGGTLTGLVNMTLTGSAWKTQTPNATHQAFYLIAHESAHMWNGHLIANTDQGSGSWMHEGSADALAAEAMLSLGIMDGVQYRARIEDVINRCAKGVTAGAVSTALSRGAIRDAYDCGFVMSLWSTAAVRRAKPTADLFTIWHDLIASSRTTNNEYDQSRYFANLQRDGVDDATVAQMRVFLNSRDSISVAIAGLQSAGFKVAAADGPPPAQFQQELARSALVHLMNQACRRVNLTWSYPAKTGPVQGCEPFATEHFVFAIDGHALQDDGAAIYDVVMAACATNGAVSLDDDKKTSIVKVPCTKALAPRPVWYRLLQ